MGRERRYLPVAALLLLVGCAPAGPATPSQPVRADQPAGQPRTLVAAIANEPPSIAALAPIAGGFGSNFSYRPFNAFLEVIDNRGVALPYLAEALPTLNTETWQVFPNGRMQTRYRLKPDLSWHDGTPFSAEDFVFAWRVAMTPGLGFVNASAAPLTLIDEVRAPDARTLVIEWRSLFPEAAVLQQGGSILGLPPLPPHILDAPHREGNPDAFGTHPYWTTGFVGTGPYRLERWEFGAFLEGTAFDGHVLGRPKIDRLRIVFTEDSNVALANLRAGTIELATDSAIDFPQALELKRNWAASNTGVFVNTARSFRSIVFQFRPEYVSPRAILDPRVRKALAHSTDRQALNEALFGGEGRTTDTIFDADVSYYPTIERAIAKYPYDARASERLMTEAGFRKGSDGVYVGPKGRFVADLRSGAGAEGDSERAILGSTWRQAGFDTTETALSPAQSRDGEARGVFPGMYGQATGAGETNQIASFSTSQIAGPANRWTGRNRQGWSHAEFDRLAEAFNATLDPDQRIQQRVRMAQLLSEELPSIMLHYNLNPTVHLAALKGLVHSSTLSTGGTSWNMHEWELR